MAKVVAVDAGGTSTRCVVAESGGRCLGFATSRSGNPVSAGVRQAASSLSDCIARALRQAGLAGDQIDAVVFSMAGGVVGRQKAAFVEPLRALGIRHDPVVKGDPLGCFGSGTCELAGYVLIAGTGACAVRVENGEMAAVADGLGWLVGDSGSGFWIGRRVVRAAFDDLSGRGPHTTMTPGVLALLGLTDDGRRDEIGRRAIVTPGLRALYAMRPVELSRFARLAFDAGDDRLARGIVARAAAELARTLGAVADPAVHGPVVLAGGVIWRNPSFADAIVAACPDTLPRDGHIVVGDGTAGAALLALREVGDVVDRPVFDTIAATLAPLRRAEEAE